MVIFDVDGTLLDTSPGILNSVRFAEAQLGLKPADDMTLRKFLGPPPQSMYKEVYGLSEEESLRAARAHRRYGMEKAIYEAKVYDGIKELLHTLKDRGIRMGVATLKLQKIADTILSHYGLKDYFDVIVGMNESESLTKADTILMCMRACGETTAVMIGDSQYDYKGAVEAGVDFSLELFFEDISSL